MSNLSHAKGRKPRTTTTRVEFLATASTLAALERIKQVYGGKAHTRNEAIRQAIHRLAKTIPRQPAGE